MVKLLLILLVGLAFESTGVVLLKKGMTQIGDMNGITTGEILRVCKAGATSPQILLGILFEALFFLCLLILMSKSDISVLWPLTGLSFVFATFAAIWFLGERVSATALDGRGAHRHRRGLHQLQPAGEGKARAAGRNQLLSTVGRRCAPPDARQRVPTRLSWRGLPPVVPRQTGFASAISSARRFFPVISQRP